MDEEKVLRFVAMKGLVLPVQLANELKQTSIIAGAVLSDLVRSNKLKISNTKVGGSPVYFLKEQRHRLQELYKYLNEKDQRTYDLLKEKKVIRDTEATPLQRVSLRNIKDFAKPVEVNLSTGKELFWRWYLTPFEEAESIIRSYFEKPKQQPEQDKEKQDPPQTKEEPKQETRKEPVRQQAPEPKTLEKEEETQKKIKAPEPKEDALHARIHKYFSSRGIEIEESNVIRKNSEIDYLIEVPSQIGKISFYCKAKSKKRCNDSDLASAFVQGQLKKLPVLFITTGDLTKKAREMLNSEFAHMMIKTFKEG